MTLWKNHNSFDNYMWTAVDVGNVVHKDGCHKNEETEI